MQFISLIFYKRKIKVAKKARLNLPVRKITIEIFFESVN